MRPVGGALEDHDAEFDEVSWTDLEEALAILTHATERSVVEEAAALLATRRVLPDGSRVGGAEASA